MIATFLFFIFSVFGITEIIIYGLPTKPIRRLFEIFSTGREFIHCPLCISFWVALGIGFLLFFGDWKIFFLSPFAGAGATYYLHKVVTVEFEPVDNPTEIEESTNSKSRITN